MTVVAIAVAAGVGIACGPAVRLGIVMNLRARDDPTRGGCPRCAAPLMSWQRPLGMVPAALRGRCPVCGRRIGPPPAVTELGGAGTFGVLAGRIHPVLVLGALCSLAAAGIVLAVVDARTQRIPDRIVVPTAVVVAAWLTAAGVVEHWVGQLGTAVAGGAATFAFYVLLVLVSGGVGLGDAKLGALCGLVLGWYGWEAVGWATTLTFVLAALWLIGRAARRAAPRKSQIALGPFLLLACVVTVVLAA